MSSITPLPILGNINEVCIVTPNIYQTIDGLTPLGIGPFKIYRFNSDTVSNRQLYDRPADFELIVAFAQQNDLVVELMQPLNGTDSLMAQYLQTHQHQAGVQHLAFHMDDLPMEDRIAKMSERGFQVAMEGIWHGAKGQCRFVFFDTKEKGLGTCLETIEFSTDWEDPEEEVYPNYGL